ncbi:hypothetical protein H0H87_012612, partial [Tephrocybe sp. NHM501043]
MPYYILQKIGSFISTGASPVALTLVNFVSKVANTFLPSSSANSNIATTKDPSQPLATRSIAGSPTTTPPDVSNKLVGLLVGSLALAFGIIIGAADASLLPGLIGRVKSNLNTLRPSPVSKADDAGNWEDDNTLHGNEGGLIAQNADKGNNESHCSDHGQDEEPDEHSDSSGVEDIPPPWPFDWYVLILALFYIAASMVLVDYFCFARVKRIFTSISRRLSNIYSRTNVCSALHYFLNWIESYLLELCDELFWVAGREEANLVADATLSIGKGDLRLGRSKMHLYLMDDLNEFKFLVFRTLKKVPSSVAECVAWLRSLARQPQMSNRVVSRLCNVLCVVAVYGSIALIVRFVLVAHARNRISRSTEPQAQPQPSTNKAPTTTQVIATEYPQSVAPDFLPIPDILEDLSFVTADERSTAASDDWFEGHTTVLSLDI